MNKKKNSQVDLEKSRTLFLQVGLIFSLLLVLSAFEYKRYEAVDMTAFNREFDATPEEMVPITIQKELLPPPPPPAPKAIILKVVVDDVKVKEAVVIDAGITQNDAVPTFVPEPDIEESIDEPEIPFIVVEEFPSYVGGEEARIRFLSKNIKYPELAKQNGIQGVVYVQFVVERDGSISEVTLLRGIGGGCDEEAMRVVSIMPRWNPGKQSGKAVRVLYRIPIKFTLHS